MNRSKNKPNMYRVTYSVMEGNNYAGGCGKRTADIVHLGDTIRFDHIESVCPIYIEQFADLPMPVVNLAIDTERASREQERKLLNIARAEEALKRAKEDANG